jgi:putative transposase
MIKHSPFRYFKTSPEIIRLAVMLYVRFPLSLRNVEDLLHERGIEISHETVRFWWNRFGPMFAAEIRRNRVSRMRSYSNWQWHLDEVFVKINFYSRDNFKLNRSAALTEWRQLLSAWVQAALVIRYEFSFV